MTKYKQEIEDMLKGINDKLYDCKYAVIADISDGSISVLREFGCLYPFRRGLTRRELLLALSCMAMVLELKEGEKS